MRLLACQQCQELPDRCECPSYKSDPRKVRTCIRCGDLKGHHLIDFNNEDRLICRLPIPEE